MQYRLLSLVILTTVLCVFLAIMTYGTLAFILLGGTFAIVLWELFQFGRELRDAGDH